MIKVGQIVRFSEATKRFCEDMSVNFFEGDIENTTFLVVEVYEDSLEVEVISPEGTILRLGQHDLEAV